MSNMNFCHHCGKPVQPDWKGCPFCRTDLTSLASAPAPPVARPAAPSFVPFAVATGDEDDDDSYIDRLPHLNIRQTALQVDIIKDRQQTETLGGAILAGAQSGPNQEANFKRDGIDPTKAMEIFKQEAGTLRKGRANE